MAYAERTAVHDGVRRHRSAEVIKIAIAKLKEARQFVEED